MEIDRKFDKCNREIKQMMILMILLVTVMEYSMIDDAVFEMDIHLQAIRGKLGLAICRKINKLCQLFLNE